MTERTEPKYRVGQVVVLAHSKKFLAFKVLEAFWYDEGGGWFYRWNRSNGAAEHMLRALTAEEAGVK